MADSYWRFQQAQRQRSNEFANTLLQALQQKAQQNVQQGTAAIANAQNTLERAYSILGAPDADQLAPELRSQLEQIVAANQQILGARPAVARQLASQAPQSFQVERQVEGRVARSPEAGRPMAAGTQGGPQSGLPQGGVARGARTVSRDVPVFGVLAQAESQLGRAGRAYEESLTEGERAFQRGLQQMGIDANITLEDMRTARAIRLQEGDQAFNEELARLAREHEVNILDLKQAFASAEAQEEREFAATEAEKEFDRALTVEERQAYRNELETLRQDIRDGRPSDFVQSQVQELLDDPLAPESIKAAARRLVGLRDEDAIETRAAALEAEAEEARQRAAEASARTGTADERAALEVRQAEAEADRLETQADLMRSEITINGKQLDLMDVQLTGEQLAVERQAFANNVANITDATNYVERAIELGMPSRIDALLEEKRNPGTHPELAGLASQVTEAELNNAYEVATQSKNITGRQQEVALAELARARNAAVYGGTVDKVNLLDTVASTYTPEEIAALWESDPNILDLREQGILGPADRAAAQSRASVRTMIESQEVDKVKLQQINGRLESYASMRPDDPAAAESALRTTLGELSSMGYLAPGEVDGIVALYRQGWSDAGSLLDAELAKNRAQIAMWGAQTAESQARAEGQRQKNAAGPQGDPPPASAINHLVDSAFEAIDREYPQCATSDKEVLMSQATVAGNDPCGEYKSRVRDTWSWANQQYSNAYGVGWSPETVNVESTQALNDAAVQIEAQFGDGSGEEARRYVDAMLNGRMYIPPSGRGDDSTTPESRPEGYRPPPTNDQITTPFEVIGGAARAAPGVARDVAGAGAAAASSVGDAATDFTDFINRLIQGQ